MSTVTYEQFCFWLRGYLAGTQRPKVDIIRKELDRVSQPYRADWWNYGTSAGSIKLPTCPSGPAKFGDPAPGVQEVKIGDFPPLGQPSIYCEIESK